MIKIPVSETQKDKIEKIYWNWICKYHIENLLQVINEDDTIKELITNGKRNLKDAVKEFLLADYSELKQIREHIDRLRKENKYIKEDTKKFLLDRYENYRKSQAGKIINVLGITVCPYCNQNHINVIHKGNKLRFWGDLDHFYNKNIYPELVICLYNMIPVCKVCNQLKSVKNREFVNPYNCNVESGIKFKTEFDEKTDLNYLQGKSLNFNIIIDKNEVTESDLAEIDLFDLENRYKQLKRNVQELIIKSKAYDNLYQDELKEKFELDDGEIKAYIFGYTNDHLNRVLSKFNLDIMEEFKTED